MEGRLRLILLSGWLVYAGMQLQNLIYRRLGQHAAVGVGILVLMLSTYPWVVHKCWVMWHLDRDNAIGVDGGSIRTVSVRPDRPGSTEV